eukprot:jgi/Chrzof1/13314/Cz07g28180.t1
MFNMPTTVFWFDGHRSFRVDHLKQKALKDLKLGHCREAICRYTEALALVPVTDINTQRILLSNRSAAGLQANRCQDALVDADGVIVLAPKWDKGYWRRAKALAALRRWPEAVHSYVQAWRLSQGGTAMVSHMTYIYTNMSVTSLSKWLYAVGWMKCMVP